MPDVNSESEIGSPVWSNLPTLRQVADVLRRAKSLDYKQLGDELDHWLTEDWPHILEMVGTVVPNALRWSVAERHLSTLAELQKELNSLKPTDLRRRVQLHTAILSTVRRLTDDLDAN